MIILFFVVAIAIVIELYIINSQVKKQKLYILKIERGYHMIHEMDVNRMSSLEKLIDEVELDHKLFKKNTMDILAELKKQKGKRKTKAKDSDKIYSLVEDKSKSIPV